MRRYFTAEAGVKEADVLGIIRAQATALPDVSAVEPLMNRIGEARIVMLGEASHGTHEFYAYRAYITRRLIEEKGFNCIAVEGDWPDGYRINRYVKGYEQGDRSPVEILHSFHRWPTWLWANQETAVFLSWLRSFNATRSREDKAGFYGLDLYSLWESMDRILDYLERNDPSSVHLAKEALHCFEPYRKKDGIAYGRAAHIVPDQCQKKVIDLLCGIRNRLPEYDGDHENVLNIEQNAYVVANAEDYYRTMVEGGPHSWNLRDKHMADTLTRLLDFHGPRSKVVLWAHNTHIGDARATDMVDEGMFNIGEIARIRHHRKGVVLVGFGSYQGTVLAARQWGAPMQIMEMPEARRGSWEYYMHKAGEGDKLLILDGMVDNILMMEHHFPHRAIGVVYDPRYEQYGNYVPSILPLRYNAFIHLDRTRALHALHNRSDNRSMPETFPSGM